MPYLDLFRLPGLVAGFVLHELGHGYVAYALGDPSPKHTGRLSLNPVRHIDPVGFLLLLWAGFGWAKPVQVNPMNFADPRRGLAAVAVAGPLANFLLALALLILLEIPLLGQSPLAGRILAEGAWINVALGVFNLLPIPPLDGSKVLAGLLPPDRAYRLEAGENAGWLILILLLVTGLMGRILSPLVEAVFILLSRLAVAF